MRNLTASYGAGVRTGRTLSRNIHPRTVVNHARAPRSVQTWLERFTWRQGVRDGAGLCSLFGIARACGL